MAGAAPSILVLGAGELGTAVLEALAAHPQRQGGTIAVLLRQETIDTADASKKQHNDRLRKLGVRLVAGNVTEHSVAELAGVLGAYDTVISCTGFAMPAGTQRRLTEAALAAGVRRYFPWQWGVDYDAVGAGSAQDLFDEQLAVRRRLRAQAATDWTVVSTGLFMSFLFLPAFGPVDRPRRTLRCLGSWDTAVSVTTPRDIGAMAAELAYRPGSDTSRAVVYVAGDTVTYGRVAELVQRRFPDVLFHKEAWDLDLLQKRLAEKPDDKMVKYQNVFAAGKGVAFERAATVNVQRGIPLEGVEDYLHGLEMA